MCDFCKPFRFCLLLTATVTYLNSDRAWPADLVRLCDNGPDFPNLTVNVGDTITWMKADQSPYGWLCQGYFAEWSLCSATQYDKVSFSFNTTGTHIYQTFYA